MTAPRRKTLITGAAGGMGRACARHLGLTDDLVLTDVAAPALDDFATTLAGEGYTVAAAHAGDLGDPALLAKLAGQLEGSAFAVVHTAGLSPSMAEWKTILEVNLVATHKLLAALEPILAPGSVAVLIASAAGYSATAHAEADALLKAPLEPGFLDAIAPFVEQFAAGGMASASGIGYMLSKRAMLSLVERKGIEWGPKGARIVSISPGLMLTPMGRKELAETAGAAQMDAATPVGRSGTALDIAAAARFLASPEAGFITGSDLRIDGGSIALVRMLMGQL